MLSRNTGLVGQNLPLERKMLLRALRS